MGCLPSRVTSVFPVEKYNVLEHHWMPEEILFLLSYILLWFVHLYHPGIIIVWSSTLICKQHIFSSLFYASNQFWKVLTLINTTNKYIKCLIFFLNDGIFLQERRKQNFRKNNVKQFLLNIWFDMNLLTGARQDSVKGSLKWKKRVNDLLQNVKILLYLMFLLQNLPHSTCT